MSILFKKKFVIILGAGRCGTSYLLNELNKIEGVNIYGENYNAFLKIIEAINLLKDTIKKASDCHKVSNIKYSSRGKNVGYIYVEWYNNAAKLKKIIKSMEDAVYLYFEDNYKVLGFKEIRFSEKKNVELLKFFEHKYDVRYVHLTRNIESQSKSEFWSDNPNAKEEIIKINKNIEEVLSKNNRYIKVDLSDIENDIYIVKKFIKI